MEVFISWSGDAARTLADGLKEWLPFVIQGITPFVSTQQDAGERWLDNLNGRLRDSRCGIMCLTPQSARSPFLNFEAGVMAHSLDSRIIPLCVDVADQDIPGPLRQFQRVTADENGAWRLVESLSRFGRFEISKDVLRSAFDSNLEKLTTILADTRNAVTTEMAAAPRNQQCVQSFTCFAREQEAQWGNDFSDEVARFVHLRRNEGKIEVPSAVFAARAELCRQKELESMHVLYATADSIKNYYNQINERWILSETPPKTPHSRKRLMIVEKGASADPDYRNLIARIHEKLENTCDLKVASDSEIKHYAPALLRDIGVFKLADERLEGLAAFSQVSTHKLFCQSPGSTFRILDQAYLARVRAQFDDYWRRADDLDIGAEIGIWIKRWRQALPEQSYHWAPAESALTRSSIDGLLDSRLPAIRIHNFATADECERFVAAASAIRPTHYDLPESDPQIAMIGTPLFECRDVKDKAEYFERAGRAREQFAELCARAGWNPIARLQHELHKRCDLRVTVAREGNREYFAGLIRFIEHGTLKHVDFAPTDAIGYDVDKVIGQIAWNLVLRAPRAGGQCRVYNCLWCKEHDSCMVSYGYNDQVSAGSSFFDITAVQGDVVMFNCRNFHTVTQSNGDRITVGSFLGKYRDGEYVMWS
jgi:hypothetical protein